MTKTNNGNGDLNFTAKLWQAADKMRNNMDAAEYKHVVLGLIFLKYISDAFIELYNSLIEEGEDPEEKDFKDFFIAKNIFYVPEKARWHYLQDNAKQPAIGRLVDEVFEEKMKRLTAELSRQMEEKKELNEEIKKTAKKYKV